MHVMMYGFLIDSFNDLYIQIAFIQFGWHMSGPVVRTKGEKNHKYNTIQSHCVHSLAEIQQMTT